MKSKLEAQFELLWRVANGPILISELIFAAPRKWRFDYADVKSRVAFEIQGGVWTKGRHARGGGIINDAEKYIEAFHLGWTVIPLTYRQLNLDCIQRLVKSVNERQTLAAARAS